MAFQGAYVVSFVVCVCCLCFLLFSFRGTSVDGTDDALDHDGNMLLQPRNVFAELGLILTHGDSRNPSGPNHVGKPACAISAPERLRQAQPIAWLPPAHKMPLVLHSDEDWVEVVVLEKASPASPPIWKHLNQFTGLQCDTRHLGHLLVTLDVYVIRELCDDILR